MAKMRRRLGYILVAAFLLLSFQFGSTGTAEAATGTWKKDSKGYYYKYSDGSYAKNQWVKTGNKWYYLKKNGYMQTGWAEIGKKWYFFNASGVMQTGWKSFGKKWYFFNTSGAMQTGWKSFGSKWYFFTAEGVMQTGWKSFGKNWYYFGTEGVMQKGWKQIGGKWYYFTTDGIMVTGQRTINGDTYVFNSSGAMVKKVVLEPGDLTPFREFTKHEYGLEYHSKNEPYSSYFKGPISGSDYLIINSDGSFSGSFKTGGSTYSYSGKFAASKPSSVRVFDWGSSYSMVISELSGYHPILKKGNSYIFYYSFSGGGSYCELLDGNGGDTGYGNVAGQY